MIDTSANVKLEKLTRSPDWRRTGVPPLEYSQVEGSFPVAQVAERIFVSRIRGGFYFRAIDRRGSLHLRFPAGGKEKRRCLMMTNDLSSFSSLYRED